MKLKLSEKHVTQQVTDLMRAKGWRAIRLHSGLFAGARHMVRIGEKGMADWQFTREIRGMDFPGAGVIMYVEVKATGKVPTAEQLVWLADARAAGFLATWTSDIDTFRDWLLEHGL